MTPLPVAVFSILGALLLREEDSEVFGADISVSQLTRGSPSAPGVSNLPVTSRQKSNVASLSAFLARIPFELKSNSGFRSPKVNKAVKGSDTSQHKAGLASDLQPADQRLGGVAPGVGNRALAAWLYRHRDEFPEIDQVIWYMKKSHTHIGICPSGSSGCVRGAPRGEFLYNDGDKYHDWKPGLADSFSWGDPSPVRSSEGLWAAAQRWLESWSDEPMVPTVQAVAVKMTVPHPSWVTVGSLNVRLKSESGATYGPGSVPPGRYRLERWTGSAWVQATASTLNLQQGFDYRLSMSGGQIDWGERRSNV